MTDPNNDSKQNSCKNTKPNLSDPIMHSWVFNYNKILSLNQITLIYNLFFYFFFVFYLINLFAYTLTVCSENENLLIKNKRSFCFYENRVERMSAYKFSSNIKSQHEQSPRWSTMSVIVRKYIYNMYSEVRSYLIKKETKIRKNFEL
jgi:hypothetical protein